ncbi:MAG: hypothetical protein IJS01_04955 [Lentisphaeria bacterium]|nr:hypothetical protein [Lentisphaeria bacterium]
MKKKILPYCAAAVFLCCCGCAAGAVSRDIRIEAEDFSSEEGGSVVIRTDKPGVSGRSISYWDDKWHIVNWSFDVPAAGRYRLSLRSASPQNALRRLWINGRDCGTFSVPATGGNGSSPENWRECSPLCGGKPVVVDLAVGKNTLSLENMDGNSLNLDSILLRRAD